MLNVLMLGNIPPPYGGVGTHVENLCRELSRTDNVFLLADRPLDRIKSSVYNGYEVYRPLVTVPTANAPVSVKDLFDTVLLNMRCYRVDCIKTWAEYVLYAPMIIRYGSKIEAEMLYALPLHEILNTKNIDVIHAHHASVRALRAFLASKLKNKKTPLVVTLHGGEFQTGKKSLLQFIFKKADRLIAVSNFIKNMAVKSGASPDKIVVIPNGVDKFYFTGGDAFSFKKKCGVRSSMLLFVGGVSEVKGLDFLVSAMPLILKSNPDTRLVLIGHLYEDYVLKLNYLVKRLGLAEHVRILGAISKEELLNAYASCDVFVLPRPHEPFGIVLLEAMAQGKPVIAVKPGGPVDFVEHGRTGFLVSYGDREQLAEYVNVLLGSSQLRSRIGERARKKAAGYRWSIVAETVRRVYEEATVEGVT